MPEPKHGFENSLLPPSIPSASDILKHLQVPIDTVQNNRDMLELAISQVERFGWTYLFEIPGCLFDQPTAGAAALAMHENTGRPRLMVLITDHSNGLIQVVEEGGMSDKLLHFMDSYAGVLELLGTVLRGRINAA